MSTWRTSHLIKRKMTLEGFTSLSVFVTAGKILIACISALSLIIAAHITIPSNFGKLSLILAVIAIGQDIVDFGGATWLTIRFREQKCGLGCLYATWRRKFILSLCLIPIMQVVFSFSHMELNNFLTTSFMLIILNFNIQNAYFQQIANLKAHYTWSLLGLTLERTCWLLIYPFTLITNSFFLGYLISMIMGGFLHRRVNSLYFKRAKRNDTFTTLLKSCSAKLNQTRVFGSIALISDLTLLDVFMIQAFSNFVQVGEFSIVFRLRNTFTLGYSSAAITLSSWIAKDPSKRGLLSWYKRNSFVLACNTLALLLIISFSGSLSRLLFGEQYTDSSLILILLALASLFSLISIPLGSYFTFTNCEGTLRNIILVTIPINLLFVAIGAHLNGAVGAAMGFMVTFTCAAIVMILILLKGNSPRLLS